MVPNDEQKGSRYEEQYYACHFYVHNGTLKYCANYCHHEYKNKQVEMIPVSQWFKDTQPRVIGIAFPGW